MSSVTDIILHTFLDDGSFYQRGLTPNADKLSDYLDKKYGPCCALSKVSQDMDGNKTMQADIFGVAINGCDQEDLIKVFKSITWQYPECAQLFIKCENDDKFRVINYED